MDAPLMRAMKLVHSFAAGPGDCEATLQQLSEIAADAVGADMVGLTVRDERGRPTTAVYTEGMVVEIDQVQYDWDRGPCLDAARTHTVFEVEDMGSDRRWPEFAAAAHGHGINSSLSVPVVAADAGLGALNFYDHRLAHFDAEKRALAELFAGQCSITALYWHHVNQSAGLRKAMESRETIEQAKGVLIATTGCSTDEAFDLLRQQSQMENRKLRDIAQEIVDRQKR
jgi:transcriptional regulator with GAF, ATPase, and Fis domain